MKVLYACVTCGKQVETDQVVYECPYCAAEKPGAPAARRAGFPRGCLSVVSGDVPRRERGGPVDPLRFLPLPMLNRAAFPAGNTPLVEPDRLRARTGFSRLFFKNDTLNPSGSLKDRASFLVAEQARENGEKCVVLASTGNAGASMACAGAAYGLSVVLFVPASAPRAKLLQSLLYGARVVPIQGTYDDAFGLSIAYTHARGGINRNTGFNPFTVEGKKTVSLEIYNQLGCQAPDVMYVPTGDGVIFSGACKGFADLMKAGCSGRMPVMVVVQAEGSNAISRSWREGRQIVLSSTTTIADSLSVSCPAAGAMALDCLQRYGGRAVEVTDTEISAAQAELAGEAGLFVEPSSAAAWAGFLKDRGNVDPEAGVVVLLTGTGFKDTAAAEKLVALPSACKADLDSALRLLADAYGMKG
ncbi:MAG: pyridoxal-phosphate dependent enzyme [Spirochaetia bacterium]|jgi:threonine synthase